MWSDRGQNAIYIQGGHFYTAPLWNESTYYVTKSTIPTYDVWKLDLASRSWTKVYDDTTTNRSLGGAALSIPELDTSYYLGYIYRIFESRLLVLINHLCTTGVFQQREQPKITQSTCHKHCRE